MKKEKIQDQLYIIKYNIARTDCNLGTTEFITFWNLIVNIFNMVQITLSKKKSELLIMGSLNVDSDTVSNSNQIEDKLKMIKAILSNGVGIKLIKISDNIILNQLISTTDQKKVKKIPINSLILTDIEVSGTASKIMSALIDMKIEINFISLMKGSEYHILLNLDGILNNKNSIIELLQITPNIKGKLIEINSVNIYSLDMYSLLVKNYPPISKDSLNHFISHVPRFMTVKTK